MSFILLFLAFSGHLCASFSLRLRRDSACGKDKDGTEVVQGRYWFRCTGGSLVAAGCLDGSTKVAIGDEFADKNNSAFVRCQSLKTEPVACLSSDGKRVNPDETVQIAAATYKCSKDGFFYTLRLSGCVTSTGNVGLENTVSNEDSLMLCRRVSDTEVGFEPVGCVHQGQKYQLGENFNDDQQMYICKLDGSSKTKKKVIGCIEHGKTYFDWEVISKGDQAYRCRIRSDSQADREIFGCVLKDSSVKSLDCTWRDDSQPPNAVLMKCERQGGQAVQKAVHCLWSHNGGLVQIDINCYRTFGSQLVGCVDSGGGAATIATFASDQVEQARQKKLSSC